MKLMIVCICCWPFFSFGVQSGVVEKPSTVSRLKKFSNSQSLGRIIPLDSATEQWIRSSSLSTNLSDFDADEKDFYRRLFLSFQKIAPKVNFKSYSSFNFLYDCLFLSEEGFADKYADLDQATIKRARQTVRLEMTN